ncbi:DUF3179 domain-containing protein [Haloplanus salilacus]|uniref:DUF3179 domain-containing protein n=1 Tax=Haloplanus salilacus TaxID=2949994 RepID=UPI0030D4C347
MRVTRRRFVAAAGLGAVAGCTGSADPGAGGTSSTSTGSGVEESIPVEDVVPTADRTLPLPMARDDLRAHAVSGGPPKDGIPSIDDPTFVGSANADFLNPGDPVFGVVHGDVVKAYPQKILVRHEIVNDHLGDRPVAVTYCPLTGTVQGFERGETTFGVSGRLINNNLVMYDRATETWWPQILATSIPGPWNETPGTHSLREFGLVWTTWRLWRERHPDTTVLSTDTGSAQNYGRDPYGSYNPTRGYYENGTTLFGTLTEDDRFDRKHVVLGARIPDGAVAFDKAPLLERGVMTGELGGTPVVAVADSDLDTGYVYLNPDGRPVASDGERVSVDGSSHDPADLPLARVHTFDAMWFAWHGYYPETDVYA